MSSIKRTYGSKASRPSFRSSSPSDLSSSPPKPSLKRTLSDHISAQNVQPAKRPRLTQSSRDTQKKTTTTRKAKENRKPKTLVQLHFSLDTSVLHTCPQCAMTYTVGAPDDEVLHKAHCARVQRGMEWGRDEENECSKAGVREIASMVKLKDGVKGRIICVKADVGGRIGSKMTLLLDSINLNLSSPPLTSNILRNSKIYLFLVPSTASRAREQIVGSVIATHISTAMAIASQTDINGATSGATLPPTATLVAVDTSTGLFCHPDPLPTPMGIPRLFVPSAHRRRGIAMHLLNAAAQTFVHGCKLDPHRGDVAFTQPTGSGKAVMEAWGKGHVRIYQE